MTAYLSRVDPDAHPTGIERTVSFISGALRVTGRIDGVPTFREGKVTRVEQWLADQGRALADFGRVSFYSDSLNDLPLLERATDPVATNPSPPLEALARSRGWRILKLFA